MFYFFKIRNIVMLKCFKIFGFDVMIWNQPLVSERLAKKSILSLLQISK